MQPDACEDSIEINRQSFLFSAEGARQS